MVTKSSRRTHSVPEPAPPLASRPLYLQARDRLVREIVDGVWKPGDYLPSEAQLAVTFGVSIGTIRRATEELAAQGLLERQHGRGTQVVPHSSDRSRFRFLRFVHPDGRSFRPVAHLIQQSVQPATREDLEHLDLPKNAEVLVLLRTRSEDGVPLIYERIALPAERFSKLHFESGQDMLEEIYVLYQKHSGETVVRAEDDIRADAATRAIATALGCEVGTPLLMVRRVAFSLTGDRVEHRKSWTATLRYRSLLD